MAKCEAKSIIELLSNSPDLIRNYTNIYIEKANVEYSIKMGKEIDVISRIIKDGKNT